MAGGGGRRWQDEFAANARSAVLQRIVNKLSGLFKADPRGTPERLRSYAAQVEEGAFSTAESQVDYMRRIAMKLQSFAWDRQRALQSADENRKQQMQMAHQMQLGNPVQSVQGGNALLTMTPQAASVMTSPMQPPSQQPNWHMSGPNMQFRPRNMMAMVNQNSNSQSAAHAPGAPGIQSRQQVVQLRPTMPSQNKRQDTQLQQTSFGSGNQARAAQLQGQPVIRPNAQPNHLLNQNVSGIYGVQQPMHSIRNHQGLGTNQDHRNSQWYQMVGANNVANLNTGYPGPGGLNSQQNVGCTAGEQSSFRACEQEGFQKQPNMESQLITPGNCGQVTINQQSKVYHANPQTPETTNSKAVDWREEMFQKIKSWKAAYFSDIMELDRIFLFREITEEQLQSLPKNKAETYKRNSHIKQLITCVLKFLQLQKSEIPDTYRDKLPKYESTIQKLLCCHRKARAHIKGRNLGQESKDCHANPQSLDLTSDTAPFNGGKSNQQDQRAGSSISQTKQNVVTATPPAHQKTDSRDPQGVTSPYFSAMSPGGLQSSPTIDVGPCCTPSPVAKSGVVQVASPYSSLNPKMQSPIATPGLVVTASPCASVKGLTSTIDKSQILATASPCSSVKTTILPNAAKSGIVQVTSPCDSVKSAAPDDINNQVTPPQLIVPASLGPAQTAAGEAGDDVCTRAKTPVAKKPIDRLLDAVRASSPSVLHSAVNSIQSALLAMDSVPFPPLSGSNNKMKRAYDITSSYSEPSPLGEYGAKRQRTQDAKVGLWDEIEAINSKLIDTTISILGGNSADCITSCGGETLIKLLYTSVSLAPNLKSHLLTTGMLPLVMPVTLLVPADYPASSPTIICDEGGEPLRKKSSVSEAVEAAFRQALRVLPEPRSLKETASAWDACVRQGVSDFVQQQAGGVLGSRFGQWESCVGA